MPRLKLKRGAVSPSYSRLMCRQKVLSQPTISLARAPETSYPRGTTHADQPVFAGGEPLDVPEAMELLSGMKRQKGQRT